MTGAPITRPDAILPAPALMVPGVGAAVRLAASDWYFHSAVLLAANVVWGVGVITVVLVAQLHVVAGVIGAVLLALPTAGLFRTAASVVRGNGATLRDALDWRQGAVGVLALGSAVVAAVVVGMVDVSLGISSGEPPGVALATMAGWGVVAVLVLGSCCWPLLCDVSRPTPTGRHVVRRAVLALMVSPGRVLATLTACGLILAVSTIMFVALLTISMGFVALVLCHVLLPLSDRFEAA